ncbi:MAG: peptidyl-prolyl cis-trans isomerase [Lentisphaeria bacterium]|nr:peptidyl-prolyl cis-trans isomerase [Lentisphaeria bacterium]
MNMTSRIGSACLPLLWLCLLPGVLAGPREDEAGGTAAARLAAAREMIPEVVVRMGGWTLGRDEVWEPIRIKVERIVAEETPFSVSLLRYLARPIVTEAIEERLLGEAAAADGFLPDLERAESHLRALLDDPHARREAEHFLRENGLSREVYVRRLALRTAITDWVKHRFVDPQEVADGELPAGYERLKAELGLPETILLERMISPRNVPEADSDPGREALVRIRDLIASGVSFSEAAGRLETGPARYDRQRIACTALPEPVAAAVAELEAGEVSGIVELPASLVLLRWQDRIPARLRVLGEVEDELRARLREEKGRAAFGAFLQERRAASGVVISPPLEDPAVPWPGHRRP